MRIWPASRKRKPAEFEGPEYEPLREPCPGCGGVGGVHEEQCPFKPPDVVSLEVASSEVVPPKEPEAIRWEEPIRGGNGEWSFARASEAWEEFTEEDRRMVLGLVGAPHHVSGMELGEVRNLRVQMRAHARRERRDAHVADAR